MADKCRVCLARVLVVLVCLRCLVLLCMVLVRVVELCRMGLV